MKKWLSLLVLVSGMVLSLQADSREDFMRDFVRYDKVFQTMQVDDEYYGLSAFFFDFNGDGTEEALASPYGLQQTDGWNWVSLCRNKQGMVEIGGPREKVWKDPVAIIYGWGRLFYRAYFSGGCSSLVGRQLDISYCVSENPPHLREVSSLRGDAVITMNDRGYLIVHELPNEIDDIVGNPGFEKLERARCENYQGHEMKRVLQGDGWFGYKPIPDEQLRPLGGIAEPPEFDTFVRRYREEVKSRLNTTNDVTVLAVFHDADNDGDVDAYVSSSFERAEGDRYKWHLYLNGKGGFVRATRRISKRVREFDDAAFVEPEEVASRTAFHRVVRYGRLPMLVVLEKVGKQLHTRGFMKYVTEEERRTQPHIGSALYDKKKGEAYHEWCEDVNARLGYIHPLDLRELVDDFSFFRLERLPCREFPEGEAFLVPSSSSKGI